MLIIVNANSFGQFALLANLACSASLDDDEIMYMAWSSWCIISGTNSFNDC